MTEGIKVSASLHKGIAAESSPVSSTSSKEDQDTFLMLMQLMFPTPDELPIQKADEPQVNVTQDKEDTGESEVENLPVVNEETEEARLAVLLNLLGYAANPVKDGSDELEQANVTEADTRVQLDEANHSVSRITLLAESVRDVSDKGKNGSKLLDTNVKPDPLPVAKTPFDSSALGKHPSEKGGETIQDNSNHNIDIDEAVKITEDGKMNTNKRVLAEQFVAELVGKKAGSQQANREANSIFNEPPDSLATSQSSTGRNSGINPQANTTQTAAPKSFHLTTPVTYQDWSNQFSQQIVWLSQQQIKSAVIRLNPKDMGGVEVNLQVDKNHATIQMTTHQDGARDAIEQSLPRLREMMNQQGLQLDDVNVQTRQQQEQGSQRQGHNKVGNFAIDNDSFSGTKDDGNEQKTVSVSKGLIDYFA